MRHRLNAVFYLTKYVGNITIITDNRQDFHFMINLKLYHNLLKRDSSKFNSLLFS